MKRTDIGLNLKILNDGTTDLRTVNCTQFVLLIASSGKALQWGQSLTKLITKSTYYLFQFMKCTLNFKTIAIQSYYCFWIQIKICANQYRIQAYEKNVIALIKTKLPLEKLINCINIIVIRHTYERPPVSGFIYSLTYRRFCF